MLDRQMTYKIISRSLISNYVEEEKLGAKLIICYQNSVKTLSKYFIPIQSFHGQSRRRNVNNILILWACSMHDYPSITTDQHRSFAFPLNEMVNDDLTLSDLSLSSPDQIHSFIVGPNPEQQRRGVTNSVLKSEEVRIHSRHSCPIRCASKSSILWTAKRRSC